MPASISVDLGVAPTAHSELLHWVGEIAELTTPDRIVWCDGSTGEWEHLTSILVNKGTFVELSEPKNSFRCISDPEDVARVEDRTFICSE
ncbi:MAG: phosphoenolpyruvate carboxykinase, partial [Rhodococcus sp. (in: high G+C Gram-positive bacteria)]